LSDHVHLRLGRNSWGPTQEEDVKPSVCGSNTAAKSRQRLQLAKLTVQLGCEFNYYLTIRVRFCVNILIQLFRFRDERVNVKVTDIFRQKIGRLPEIKILCDNSFLQLFYLEFMRFLLLLEEGNQITSTRLNGAGGQLMSQVKK
jgi:hypothetical protein